jgi:hypothetical protein
MMTETKPLVITHASCNDGRWAAHVAQLYYGPDNVEIFYAAYGMDPPPVEGRDVLLTDFSYSREILEDMYQKTNSLKVLDHHKSAQKDLEGLPYCCFDMNHSGAVMAWKHFFPDEEVPAILLYVEDYDLWRFQYPETKEIVQGMYTDKSTEKALEGLQADRGAALCIYYKSLGHPILMKQEQDVL